MVKVAGTFPSLDSRCPQYLSAKYFETLVY